VRIEPVSEFNAAHATQLGKEVIEQSQLGIIGPDFEWAHSLATVCTYIGNPNQYMRIAFDDDDSVQGFVGGRVVQFFHSPKLMGIEDVWYVRETVVARAKVGMALMRGFVQWALDDKMAVMVQSGDIAGINSEAVWALYNHMGFKRFGSIYRYSRGIV
jgi:hypothetical protein